MKKVLLLAALFVGMLALATVLTPPDVSADGCFAACMCAPGEGNPAPGATKGCIGAADNTASICGNASTTDGCVCVGGQCLEKQAGASVPVSGCANPDC